MLCGGAVFLGLEGLTGPQAPLNHALNRHVSVFVIGKGVLDFLLVSCHLNLNYKIVFPTTSSDLIVHG